MVDPACLETIRAQAPEHRAAIPRGADPKWRFFWRLGPRPQKTQFAELNAEPVVPAGEHARGTLAHLLAMHLNSLMECWGSCRAGLLPLCVEVLVAPVVHVHESKWLTWLVWLRSACSLPGVAGGHG